MYYKSFIIFCILGTSLLNGSNIAVESDSWDFPDDLLMSTATAAYQIEGGWNASDKGESVWDRYTHTRLEKIANGSNGDVACDSYHKFKEDVKLMKQLGVDTYRFSLSWPRILPTGYANNVSEDGLRYYHDLLDELEKNGIDPVVTIYHWDHPQIFQDMGGWANEIMVDLFGDYARVVYREFGDRVKTFVTINEPISICRLGYFDGKFPPGVKLWRYGEYHCDHNILKAHARAYHIYNDEFRNKQDGKIGIVLHSKFWYPKQENDTVSAEVAFQFFTGIYAHPIFSKDGDYPEIVKKRVAENSKFEGLQRSRLPTFSEYWKNYIKGTSDFFGLNHYTSQLVEPLPRPTYTIYENDDGLNYTSDESWPGTASSWLKVVPEGFGDLLRKIKDDYDNPTIYITESGVSDSGTLEDDARIEYLYSYMKSMLTAIKDGCNVKMYTIWSLLDNFEWINGYTEKFGLYNVDFTHPNRTRTPKKSTSWLEEVIRTRKLQPPFIFPTNIKRVYASSVALFLGLHCNFLNWVLPDDLRIGVSSAAYQIEGAWNVSDKGESMWDRYTHTRPEKISDGSNGDVACDSYHKYKEDVKLLKQLGVDTYRFSLSWTRILPTGYSNNVSKDGIKYYHDLLDELEKNGIEPLVTIYHWDHPQIFQDMGGWMNEIMVDLLGDYARVVYREFGDRVKTFFTINEPNILCQFGYNTGDFAPGLKLGRYGEYQCGHNILKAHARAYHIYNDEFRSTQNGKVGIVTQDYFYYPKHENDTVSAEIAFQFFIGQYAHPIFSKDGDYPEIVKKRVAENSKYEGLQRSRLPIFSEYWKNYIKGSSDFFGLNHYFSYLVEPLPRPNNTLYENDDGLNYTVVANRPGTSFQQIVPQGFEDLLRKIRDEYDNPIVYVTENGSGDEQPLEDDQRIEYLYSYMRAMLNAIKDGCIVKLYSIWSFLDDFEWGNGYTIKFGLFHVDFTHPNRTRTPKKSAEWLREVTRTRKLLSPNL